jgi:hypothetical protein
MYECVCVCVCVCVYMCIIGHMYNQHRRALGSHFPKRNSLEGLRVSHIRCYVTLAISGDHCPVTVQWNSVWTSGNDLCSFNHQALCNTNSVPTSASSSKTHALHVLLRRVYLKSTKSSPIYLYSFYLHVLPIFPCTGSAWIVQAVCEFYRQCVNFTDSAWIVQTVRELYRQGVNCTSDFLKFLIQASNNSGFWRNNFPHISCKLHFNITILWQKILCTCRKLMSNKIMTHPMAFCFT